MKKLDESIFSESNTMVEVLALAKKLKQEGYSPMEVNALVTKRRLELIQKSNNNIRLLKKVIPKSSMEERRKITQLPIEVRNLSSGVIEITKEGKVIL